MRRHPHFRIVGQGELLDETTRAALTSQVLLVRGFQKGASWSFPRGKINKEEPEADCAVREVSAPQGRPADGQVLEETGYDLLPHFPVDYNVDNDETRDPYFVELVIKEQRIRLYFIPHVKEDAHFETRTRKEIGVRRTSSPDWADDGSRRLTGSR